MHHSLIMENNKKTCIPIDDNYALGADQYSWHIAKKVTRKRKGKPVDEWQAIKWYTSLESAINHFVDLKLRVSGATTLVELQKEQEKVLAALCKALHPKYKAELAA